MLNRVTQLRDRGDDKTNWNEAIGFYEHNIALVPSIADKHYHYCELAGAYWFDERNEPGITTADVFGSPFSLGFVINPSRTAKAIGLTLSSTYDLSPLMAEIQTPALLLWGADDGVIPAEMADDAYASLGATEPDKRRVVFEHAAHSPMFEAPQAFEAEVRVFLERVRNGP
jgi:pimeloyl-ACP methyl ester carboxylesterase